MPAISFRSDADTDAALAELTADGATPSEAIRSALLDTARRHRQERLREVVSALSADPEYLEVVRGVREVMEPLRAW